MPSVSKKVLAQSLTLLLTCAAAGVITPMPVQAATATTAASELAPMLAPVALYPDPLLAQVLTASQFPDQVGAASRWVAANPKVTGTAAARAAARQKWNPAVQSLVQFPAVLKSMASQPAWMKSLGDTYARRPADVMASVQQLRRQAQQSGHLKSSQQQKVVVTGTTISIDPPSTNVVYVPAYDPRTVYGTWAYAAPPVTVVRDTTSSAVAGVIGFGVGVAVANALWGDIDWGHNKAVVNNYYNDKSVYVDNSSSNYVDQRDQRDQSSHYSDNSTRYDDHSDRSSHDNSDHSSHADNSDHSSRYEDNSDHSSSQDDHSDNSSRDEDNSDNSSYEEDNSDNSSNDDTPSDDASSQQDDGDDTSSYQDDGDDGDDGSSYADDGGSDDAEPAQDSYAAGDEDSGEEQ